MLQTGAAGLGDQLLDHSASRYERHRPEQTHFYQIANKHYPDFLVQLAAEGESMPDHVHREFTDFLKCGLLEHGFLRVRCESCHHEKLVAFSWPLPCIHAPAALVNPLRHNEEVSAQAAVLAVWWIVRHR